MSPGFAHGFYVISEYAVLHYNVTEEYDKNDENGFIWNDKSIKIDMTNPSYALALRKMGGWEGVAQGREDLLLSQISFSMKIQIKLPSLT